MEPDQIAKLITNNIRVHNGLMIEAEEEESYPLYLWAYGRKMLRDNGANPDDDYHIDAVIDVMALFNIGRTEALNLILNTIKDAGDGDESGIISTPLYVTMTDYRAMKDLLNERIHTERMERGSKERRTFLGFGIQRG